MVVVFDGQCLICNGWVRFLLNRSGGKSIRFAAMQGATGSRLLQEAGLQVDRLETLLVLHQGRSYQHTDAILQVLHALGWPWRLAGAAKLVPRPWRDAAYRGLARNRYRLFGRRDVCSVPATADRPRFLD